MRTEYIQNINSIIEIPLPENYCDCFELVKSDYLRYRHNHCHLFGILLYTFKDYNFAYCFWLRLSKYEGWLFPFCRWRLECAGRKHGMSFSRNVKVGYGFKIVHAIGIIVNATAVIGSNCTIHQLTTIGSDKDKAAIIGDNVYIGPNVCFVENVHIGNHAKIGAGAVVVKDIPAGVVAIGVPARFHQKNPIQLNNLDIQHS